MNRCEITGAINFFIPRKVNYAESKKLNDGFYCMAASIKYLREIRELGWTIYAVDAVCGRCSYASKSLTVPVWALKKGTSYALWYVAHEMAHVFARGDQHGQIFMSWLKRICPPECLYHELGYKPKAAATAGIMYIPDDL